MSEPRLQSIVIDEASLSAASRDQEHEREIAIFDLLEGNYFAPEGAEGGPYDLSIALIENQGMVGVSLFMGGNTTPSSAVVQTMGYAYRLPARLLKLEFDRSGLMQKLMLRYTQALMTQMAQTAACNRHHSVEQQLCRWLLLAVDRDPSRELVMTHELVASMLGVRREGITEAAGNLQAAGVIRYRRGHISVLARSGLEKRTCECYAVVRKEWGRLLSDVQYRQVTGDATLLRPTPK